MSKNFKKYFFNNLKEAKYLSNIDRVEFDSARTDANSLLSDREISKRREELDDIQIRVRHNNMRIYLKNMFDHRLKQVFSLAVPTALVVGTVASFVAPYRRVVDKKFTDTIVKESTILSNTNGQINDNSDIYYYSSSFFSLNEYTFVKDNEHGYSSSLCYDNLTYQISDGIDSVLAKFSYDSEGKLTFNSVDVGKYIDVSEYDFSESSAIDEKYERLFDDVLNLILSEDDLSSEAKETLKVIAESEKKNIIINIVNYENVGAGTAEIYKSRFFQRFILLIVTGLYGALLYACCKDGDMTKGTKLYVYDGELQERENSKIGFLHVGLKYKEAFIRAEVERIKKAQELAEEYVSEYDVSDLFTSFEKNLTLTNNKER